MSDWGKGVINDIGWGQGADNNDIGWGSIYSKSFSGDTLLSSGGGGGGGGGPEFIIEVDSSKAGTPSNQFQFTGAEGDYDVVAKQNDIIVQTFADLSGQETITFSGGSGVYILEVTPKEVNGFNRIVFDSIGDVLKIIDVKQWGTIVWSSFRDAFNGCDNLLVTASDVPDLSIVTDMSIMFNNLNLANPNVSNWDVSNVTNMFVMFAGATSANPDVSNWDVSNVTNMFAMFLSTQANPNLSLWNVINVTDMGRMFESSNLSVENLTLIYENWSQLNLQQNVDFGAGTTKYNASGQAGRDILINTYNWSLSDGGQV